MVTKPPTGRGFGTRAHSPVLAWSRAFAGGSWSRRALLGFVGSYRGFIKFFIGFYLSPGFIWLALVGFGGFWWERPENAPVFVGFRFFTRKINAPYHKTDFPIPKREQHHSIFSLYLGGDRTFLYQGANLSYTTQGTFLYYRPNIPGTALFNTKNGSILKRALCYTKNNTTPRNRVH